ncbi:MAG: hypothetical protein ACTSRA_00470 [Promethearchaeota archaeon]|nr:MAG: hypothetical protein [Helarchaeota virus Nidhogg Meg22_1012]URC17430.1 MAG: hypothetical protein [Helarchaeota virus Nidhogg Meg22_1214]
MICMEILSGNIILKKVFIKDEYDQDAISDIVKFIIEKTNLMTKYDVCSIIYNNPHVKNCRICAGRKCTLPARCNHDDLIKIVENTWGNIENYLDEFQIEDIIDELTIPEIRRLLKIYRTVEG